MRIRVQAEAFDPGSELETLTQGNAEAGASVCFIGTVRSGSSDPIESMTIEHYPGMTEAAISGLVREAESRWALLDCLVIHRFGRLFPGERIVMVAALSAHRTDAFRAAEFIMDYLKSRAPFWKKEHRADGGNWVRARSADEASLERWHEAEKA